MAKLSEDEVAAGLGRLPGWHRDGDTIERTYQLPDFRTALAFVAAVGELAEQMNHHPDIDIRYDRVRLALSTHSEGGLTGKDFELARKIDQIG
jgi:4a-hydroxytetrahydrobiopterin dehydratase